MNTNTSARSMVSFDRRALQAALDYARQLPPVACGVVVAPLICDRLQADPVIKKLDGPVFGFQLFRKEQRAAGWMFYDRKIMLDYLDGKISEAELETKKMADQRFWFCGKLTEFVTSPHVAA